MSKTADPATDPKCCWNLIKTLLNGGKISCTSLLTPKKRAKKNSFIAKQWSLFDYGSTLPLIFPLITDKSLSDVDFSVKIFQTSSANLIQIKLTVKI